VNWNARSLRKSFN